MSYKPKYFKGYELVPPSLYNSLSDDSEAYQYFDDKLLIFMDYVRYSLGVVTVNTWYDGGTLSQRALRTEEAKEYVPVTPRNRRTNNHPQGKAIDFNVSGYTAKQVRDWIIENRNHPSVYPISFLEDDVSWVHVDVRENGSNQLTLWSPKSELAVVYDRDVDDYSISVLEDEIAESDYVVPMAEAGIVEANKKSSIIKRVVFAGVGLGLWWLLGR